MGSTQGFFFDVFNNTTRTLSFQITANACMNGAQVGPQGRGITIPAPGWMSAETDGAPFPLSLNGCDTGSLTFQVQDVSSGETGSFTLEFDGTRLSNFAGMALYGSAGDIADPVITSNGYIFPLLYMNRTYGGNPLAVLMFLEGLRAMPDVDTPYSVT